jgi:hypothetical protein
MRSQIGLLYQTLLQTKISIGDSITGRGKPMSSGEMYIGATLSRTGLFWIWIRAFRGGGAAYSPVVTIYTTYSTVRNRIFRKRIYVICTIPTIKSNYLPNQQQQNRKKIKIRRRRGDGFVRNTTFITRKKVTSLNVRRSSRPSWNVYCRQGSE